MSNLKKSKVVMLPTNEKAIIGLNKANNRLYIHEQVVRKEGMNLYFLSDEGIEASDWKYFESNNGLFSDITKNLVKTPGKYWKVIATTDKSLFFDKNGLIPEPSIGFINKYIEEYNKGNIITEVLVEYEDSTGYDDDNQPMTQGGNIWNENLLKINPKDNTITIKPVKQTWTKEEVIKYCSTAFFTGYANGSISDDKILTIHNKWIENNL